MLPRLLFVTGEGVGNIIQTFPVVVSMQFALNLKVDILLTNSSFNIPSDLIQGISILYPEEFTSQQAAQYMGKVVTVWGDVHGKDNLILKRMRLLNSTGRQMMRLDQSEVSVYFNIAREMGVSESRFTFDVSSLIVTEESEVAFDVVLCNGYNYKNTADMWEAKTYPQMPELAERFRSMGLSTACVGSKSQYIEGTIDCTGLPLKKSLGLLKQARLVVSTDSGMYHAGCLLRKPTVALFTFTSVQKNYDKRFHQTASIVRRKPLLPCMADCHSVMRWKKCPHDWKCQHIDLDYIVQKAEKLMK